jgi:flagellum-specific peptidoglycan hydrolase FlgJ
MARTVAFFITALLLTSCGSKKVVYNGEVKRNAKKIENKSPKQTAKKRAHLDAHMRMKVYVVQYAPLAQKEMKKFGIPASITLAQGLLESQAGVGKLAVKSNNHFGIKCHKGWRGPSVSHDDDAKGECFRKYKKVAQSYRDHSEFLRYRDRYSKLFKMNKTDYVSWAHGLKKAGYATDPQYAYKLISLIERYELWQFDGSKKPIKTEKIKKDKAVKEQGVITQNYTVKQGDTLYAIAKQFNTSVQALKELNGLLSNELAVGQQLKVK